MPDSESGSQWPNQLILVSFQITPLLWRPQGPQGCLEKRNCPLSLNFVVWCAKIGPKNLEFLKNLINDKKNNKKMMVFWSFWVLGPILAHQTANFELSGQFHFSRHPWGPRGCQSSGVICIWKIYQLFCDSGTALVDFFTFMKMLPNVEKVFLSISIAKITNFLQKCTLWRHNFETFWGPAHHSYCKHFKAASDSLSD